MAPIDLNLLRAFAMVYEDGTFAAAAKRMAVPRSTVSRAIAALETEVGEPLFHRTTRSMRVTAAGRALYDRVAPGLASLRAALEELPRHEEEPSGTVTVTSTADIGQAVFAEAAARLVLRWPKVRVDVILTSRVVDFGREGVDLALRFRMSRLEGSALVARKVGEVAFHLYAAPAYLARRGAPRAPADFPQHDWVGLRGADGERVGRVVGFPELGAAARVVSDDMFFARDLVRRGVGIATLPSFLAEADVASGALVRIVPRWTFSSGEVYMIHRPSVQLPLRVRAFREIVLDVLQKRPLGAHSNASARSSTQAR